MRQISPCKHCGCQSTTALRKVYGTAQDWYNEEGIHEDSEQGEGLDDKYLKTVYCTKCGKQRRDLKLMVCSGGMRVVEK